MKMFDDRVNLSDLSADELRQLMGELQASLRHPAMIFKPNMRNQAGKRLAAVEAEFNARWRVIWDNNAELADVLLRIYILA